MNKGRAGNSRANGEIIPGEAKAFVIFKGASANGAAVILAALNVASVVRTGAGLYTVTFQRPFSTPYFAYAVSGKTNNSDNLYSAAASTDPGSAMSKQLQFSGTAALYDPREGCFTAWGPQ